MDLVQATVNGVPGLLSRHGHFFLPIPTHVGGNPDAVAHGTKAVAGLLDVGAAEEAFLLFQDEQQARAALAMTIDERVGVCVMETGGRIVSLSRT